ncbi:MAG: phenylacetate--CoA ligase family protein [Vicinamibacteria bacterium]
MYSRLLRHVLLPAAFRWRGRPYLDLAARIRRNQYRPRELTADEQRARVRELVRLATDEVAYYRERYRDLGSLEDLESLPVLTKEDLLLNFPDRMTAGRSRPGWQYVGTRGTTDRVMVVHDEARRDLEWACRHVVMTEDSEYDLGKPIVLIPPDECSKLCAIEEKRETRVLGQVAAMTRESRLSDEASRAELRRLVMESWIRRAVLLPPFGAEGSHIGEEKLDLYVKRIEELRPVLLKALPEYLVAIARRLLRSSRPRPRVPVVKPMGSKLSPSLNAEIESAFRGTLREDYGSQEVGAMAFDCRYGRGLHILEDSFLIEIARDGERVPDGELGVVLITDLENRAMPLIRYRIGDVGRIDDSPCPCGRTSRRLFIEGRLEDTFVTPEGRARTAETVGELLYREPGIDDFQLVEGSDGFWELSYVARPEERVEEKALEEKIRRELGIEGALRMRKVRTLLPESSGKFRHSKSRSFLRFDGASASERAHEAEVGR